MAYFFYLSFSRRDNSEFLRQFFADLDHEVRIQSGSDEGGFLDEESISPGDSFETAILDGIQNSRTFVPLLSPSYLSSEYCGKELQLFLMRQDAFNRASA